MVDEAKRSQANISTIQAKAMASSSKPTEAALQTVSETNQQDSPFLHLPAEIRNAIYHFALGGHEIYAITSGARMICMCRPSSQFAWSLKHVTESMALYLPLVCRQLRSELGRYFILKFSSVGSTSFEHFLCFLDALTED
jgi:hypothetical protein